MRLDGVVAHWYTRRVEPIPETLRAFGELGFDLDELGLEDQLRSSLLVRSNSCRDSLE